ncbi:MAG: hypothetical protein IJH13_04715 [Bacilli bacterium]|nr:hypothetical protein [Bacilli bacterium]
MKKVLNIKNMGLLLIIVLIAVLTINTKEAKAAGTVTWSGPSSITIRDTIHNIANPIVASTKCVLFEGGDTHDDVATTTINYTASDTPTNYQITKSATMNLSSLTFTKPGDYSYNLVEELLNSNAEAFWPGEDAPYYKVTISVRNIVDANNVPTGNFTASLIIEKCISGNICSKINPVSGNLIVDFDYETNPESFGHIEISKTVKGIGADINEYFPFTVSIDDADDAFDGWVYPISGIDSTVTYNGSTVSNPTTITSGTPTTIYLKHGQTAIIGQVTSGGNTFDAIPNFYCTGGGHSPTVTSYNFSKNLRIRKLANIDGKTCYGSYVSISENSGSYTPSISLDGSDYISGDSFDDIDGLDLIDNTSLPVESETNAYYFVNTKEMSPVTGLILTILPYLILAGIGIGGTLLVMHLKKQKVDA